MGCEYLLEELRQLATTSLLNDRTVLRLYNDAIEHEDTFIMEACSQVIIARFEDICQRDEEDGNLMELSLENFTAILKSDKLNLVNEEQLIELVRKYIAIRDAVPSKAPTTAEEKCGANLWALLNDAEREAREKVFDEEQKKTIDAENELKEKEATLFQEMTVTEKIQHVLNKKQEARNLKIKVLSDKRVLTEDEKIGILRCIRFNFLP